jgi:N-methylhydantoinase A/oxoprolinase/acetone carboxylase beta subunit
MLLYAPEKRPPHQDSQAAFLHSQKDVIALMHDLRLGIDVGGTNTDAVVLDAHDHVLAKAKTPTTADVVAGIAQAIELVLTRGIPAQAIGSAMLGTTQCINAILQREHLGRVGVVRLGAPATLAIPPLTDWPEDLRSHVAQASYIVAGGHEFDGREISSLDEARLRTIGQELAGKVDALAVSAVFSPVNPEHERRAAAILREAVGERIPLSLSHEIGSLSLLERENATVLNAALIRVIQLAVEAFRSAVAHHGIAAHLYLTQNDGTLMALPDALHHPILTVASGPTNSIRGAASLTGLREAMVVDVGGTTTDIGSLQHGFPRQAAVAIAIGGVRTNFRMPDLLSLGLGGGSIVQAERNSMSVGPRSVGSRLATESRIFGGNTLTMTDIAVAAGMIRLGDPARVRNLAPELVEQAVGAAIHLLTEGIDRVKASPADVPLIAVGGGSILVPDGLPGATTIVRPEHFDCANAIGAAIAQVSGEVDRIWHLEGRSRESILAEAREMACEKACRAGADPDTLELIDSEDIPLAYLPGNAVRLRVKVAGWLKLHSSERRAG